MTILSLPDRELFLAAVQASTNATLKIVILVLLGVIATTQGTCTPAARGGITF